MTGYDEQRQMWVVIGPLDPDKLPAGCRAEKLAPAFVPASFRECFLPGAITAAPWRDASGRQPARKRPKLCRLPPICHLYQNDLALFLLSH